MPTKSQLQRELAETKAENATLRRMLRDPSVAPPPPPPATLWARIRPLAAKYGGVFALLLSLLQWVIPAVRPEVRFALWVAIAVLAAYPLVREIKRWWVRVGAVACVFALVASIAYAFWPGPDPDAPINHDALRQKYSLGYIVYEPFKARREVFPFNKGILDKFHIDIGGIRLEQASGRLKYRLPPIRYPDGTALFKGLQADIPALPNEAATGQYVEGVAMGVEIVALRRDGLVVAVVGFSTFDLPEGMKTPSNLRKE